jgi:hypothetical protein
MAQGTIKKSKPTPTSTRRPTILGPKKGARAIAPRKAVLVKQKKLTKVFLPPPFPLFLYLRPKGPHIRLQLERIGGTMTGLIFGN